MNLNEIEVINYLKNMNKSEEAKELLYRIAKVVQPLLQRRKWKIKYLNEFYPNNSSLHGLNINRGYTIKIRLRSPEKYSSFTLISFHFI